MQRSLPLILLAAFISSASAAWDHSIPLVPLTSLFSHWDHHWFVWLPRHPVYESVEIMSRDAPENPVKLVWVFFTERAGPKRQVHYLNNLDVVTRWGGSLYRDIHYERSGTAGQAQGVTVRLHDQKHQPVDIDITVDARPLRPAGLTDQSGHAATRHFLVFFREQQALAVRNRVVIAGEDFSFNTDDGSTARYRFKAAYSANVYVVTLPFTTTRFRSEDEHLTSTAGHLFTTTRSAEEEVVSTSPAGGSPEVVQLAITTQGGLKTYTHQMDGHRFTIRFTPPLVWGANEHPEPVTYRMSLDRFPDLVHGQVQRQREGQRLVLAWRHTSPQWAQAYAFQSVITLEEDGGYQLAVSPLR
jgi:hypothetical protein